MIENENVEFKEIYTDNVYKEIVAFLNTNSGTIYIGADDNGNIIGLDDAKTTEEKISNGIKNLISPECSIFVSVKLENIEEKEYICIKVSKGNDIYFLSQKGITKGTYIRTGSCSLPASGETLKQLILKNNNITFETSISNNQNLSFDYALKVFKNNNIDLNNENIKKNLHLMTEDGVYTNLALLLSDQNPFSIKIAAYQTTGKEHFLDRKEFTGSVIETYDKLIDYLKLNSATYGIVETTNRVDIEEYPEFIIREIALNSIIHRDYSTLTSNIINIYKDNEIEFISYGALYGNITVDDILNGLSTTRNPYLQSIFMRLNEVEAIGSGLKRVNEFYKSKGLKLQINALPSSFIVKLPRIDLTFPKANDDEQKIYNYIQNTGYITRKEAETLLGKERTATTKILNKMIQNGTIKKTGNSTSVRYEIKEWF